MSDLINIKPAPQKPALTAAQRTEKLLRMRWSAPVGKGSDKINTKLASRYFATA